MRIGDRDIQLEQRALLCARFGRLLHLEYDK
jgi:hypothetical protein